MREIKFRGKDDKGNWVYGYPIIVLYKAWIKDISDTTTNPRRLGRDFADFRCVEVEKETVEQYTGLKDKNGKEIYEGDVVLCKIHDKEYMGLVEYTNTYGFYYLSGMGYSDTELWGCNEKKVIGNIHENKELLNPELLEVQE